MGIIRRIAGTSGSVICNGLFTSCVWFSYSFSIILDVLSLGRLVIPCPPVHPKSSVRFVGWTQGRLPPPFSEECEKARKNAFADSRSWNAPRRANWISEDKNGLRPLFLGITSTRLRFSIPTICIDNLHRLPCLLLGFHSALSSAIWPP